MKHNYLENTPVETAKTEYREKLIACGFSAKHEKIPVTEANGRKLYNAVYAAICSPHYNASAMDGISLEADLTYGAAENTPVEIPSDCYTVVDTGDAIPDGHNAVVMVEDIIESENGSVILHKAVHPWENIRQVGEDICMGDMIAATATVINPYLCGAMLAGGITEADVFTRPVVGIIPTGDEIVPPTSAPEKGEIIEFNSTIFSGMLNDSGADARVYNIVKDKKDLLKEAVSKALSECDIVLILAGSSAGRDDYTSEIVSEIGEVVYHGLAAKPGKPAILGIADNKPVIGLPGYPVSAIVVMDEIVKSVIDLWYHKEENHGEYTEAILSTRVVSSLKYKEYIRVTLGRTKKGLIATPLPRGAGVVTSMTKAAGILEIPQDSEGAEAGSTVRIRLLKALDEIEKALVITGSHDPMIDEIADMLKQDNNGFSIISSHVGSMGAIKALREKRAQMGAIHLLDENTGEYNTDYIDRHFPEGGVTLIKGVNRIQGLMVRKGNPLNIQSFRDIDGCRYVNRQRGAGTRILCDYLLKKNDMHKPEGYENEEFTHTAVAAVIAAGNADCGLGIYSAAKMYDLDFIPVCKEEYDFIVDNDSIESTQVTAFFETLRSDKLKQRLEEMGGYSFNE